MTARQKLIYDIWRNSQTVSQAFQECIDSGIYGEVTEKNRKQKLQLFRSSVVRLMTKNPEMKKMGRRRVTIA